MVRTSLRSKGAESVPKRSLNRSTYSILPMHPLPSYRKDGCTYDLATLLLTVQCTPDIDSIKLYLRCLLLSALEGKPCTTAPPTVSPEAQWMLDRTRPLFSQADTSQLTAMLALVA